VGAQDKKKKIEEFMNMAPASLKKAKVWE